MSNRSSVCLLSLLAAACASTTQSSVHDVLPERSPAVIAGQLADDAEMRGDPNHMRVLVYFRAPQDRDLEVVAPDIEREVVTALSGRFHLFDSHLAESFERSTWEADLQELVERLDVTHALVCDTAMKSGEILLSMRLVEHANMRIVASAQGSFPIEALTDGTRVALAERGERDLATFSVPPAEYRLAALGASEPVPLRVAGGPPPTRTLPMRQVGFDPVDPVDAADAGERTLPLRWVASGGYLEHASAPPVTGPSTPQGPENEIDPSWPPAETRTVPETAPVPTYRGPAARRLASKGSEKPR